MGENSVMIQLEQFTITVNILFKTYLQISEIVWTDWENQDKTIFSWTMKVNSNIL